MPETVHLVAGRKWRRNRGQDTSFQDWPLLPRTGPYFLLHSAVIYDSQGITLSVRPALRTHALSQISPVGKPHFSCKRLYGVRHTQTGIVGVLTDAWVDTWICLYKQGKPPWLLGKLTLAHSKITPASVKEQPLGRRPVP